MANSLFRYQLKNGEIIDAPNEAAIRKIVSKESNFVDYTIDANLKANISEKEYHIIMSVRELYEMFPIKNRITVESIVGLLYEYFSVIDNNNLILNMRSSFNARPRDENQILPSVHSDMAKINSELKSFRSQIQSVKEAQSILEIQLSEFAALSERLDMVAKNGEMLNGAMKEKLNKSSIQIVKYATKAKAEFEGIKSAYLEAMELQAPNSYWSSKAERHEERQNKIFWSVSFAAASVIALPVAALWFVSWGWIPTTTLPPNSPEWAVVLGPAKGLIAAILTSAVSIWALRILSKIYLSERHLAQDARERVTMITTYLALIKERGASESDRGIILQALFRTSSDGIVKDEGSLDPSALGLLSKILERRP